MTKHNKYLSMLLISLMLVGMFAGLLRMASAATYNYGEALQKAIFFYMEQRSGDLPDDNPVIWRADSCLKDGSDVGKDLTGGYFDAGDHVKFGLPMAYTVAQLGWAVYEYGSAFQSAGQLDKVKDAIKWGADYFVKCHTATNEFYYQVGDPGADHAFWGPAEVLDTKMSRPSYKVTSSSPGSTVVAETAAALAVAYKVLGNSNYLTHAKQLFDFAYSTKSDSGYTAASGYYNSYSGFWDELAWAAVWLYIATNDSTYLTKAQECVNNWGKEGQTSYWSWKWAQSWDDVHYGAQILLARITGNQTYVDSIDRNFAYWIPDYASKYGSSIPGYDGSKVTYTPGGLAWLDQWGSLRYATTQAFLAFVWSDYVTDSTKKSILQSFAEKQTNYALGSNPRSGSYMCGFGTNPPYKPHHRTAHGSWANDINTPDISRHILHGALVGGPDSSDNWADDRTDYTKNEVACDYNAGFVGALAKMYSLYGGTPISGFPRTEDFQRSRDTYTEYFANAKINAEGATFTEIAVDLTNHAAWPATVKDKLSYRYFFDISEVLANGYKLSDIQVVKNYAEVPVTISGPTQYSGNIYYITVDYSGTAIYPGGQSECARETQVRLKLPDTAPDAAWDPTNDWSYKGLTTSQWKETTYIPVYDNGKLLYGKEPGTTTTTATTTATTTTTRTTTTTTPTTTTTTTTTTPTTTATATRVTSTITSTRTTTITTTKRITTTSGTKRITTSVRTTITSTIKTTLTTTIGTTATTTTTTTPTTTTTATTATTTPTTTTTTATTATGTVCSPATDISVPFTYDGAGTYCWRIAYSADLVSGTSHYINSWNLQTLTVNGVDYTNKYAFFSQLPSPINNYWYIYYVGNYAWSHFEAK